MRNLKCLQPLDLGLPLQRLVELKGAPWTAGSDFKRAFRAAAMSLHGGYCAYCSIEVGDNARSHPDIEHFAHKSQYPEWTFELQNLLLACKYCNQTLKKTYNVLLTRTDIYENCEFAIVHPYIDSYQDHISGGFYSLIEEPAIPAPLTIKGLRTIRLFRLNTAAMLKLWMRIHMDMLTKRDMGPVENAMYERAKEELSGYSH